MIGADRRVVNNTTVRKGQGPTVLIQAPTR